MFIVLLSPIINAVALLFRPELLAEGAKEVASDSPGAQGKSSASRIPVFILSPSANQTLSLLPSPVPSLLLPLLGVASPFPTLRLQTSWGRELTTDSSPLLPLYGCALKYTPTLSASGFLASSLLLLESPQAFTAWIQGDQNWGAPPALSQPLRKLHKQASEPGSCGWNIPLILIAQNGAPVLRARGTAPKERRKRCSEQPKRGESK